MEITATGAAGHQAAARAVVRATEKAYNAHDAAAVVACYGDRAVWTNVRGARAVGRAAIAAHLREFFVGAADRHAHFEVVDVMPIRGDVLAVSIHLTPTDAAGESVAGAHGALLYVIAEGTAGWEILACQYTAVAA